jgi:IS30 family transposase
MAIKNASRQAHSTTKALFNYMQNSLDKIIKTLTLDNDPAFALHEQIVQNFDAKVYFGEPYKSYQKGGVENANRLLRAKFPKRMNIDKIEQPDIDRIVDSLNDRPMKCLNYATPKEAFFKHCEINPFNRGSRLNMERALNWH